MNADSKQTIIHCLCSSLFTCRHVFLCTATALLLLTLPACDRSEQRKPTTVTSADPAEPVTFNVTWPYKQTNAFDRLAGQISIREITHPTEANLDQAAYDANGLTFAPAEFDYTRPNKKLALVDLHFDILDKNRITDRIEKTPLTIQEAARPFAWSPALEHIRQASFDDGQTLADVGWAIDEHTWNDDTIPGGRAYQRLVTLYLHATAEGNVEPWVKIEFAPWVDFLDGIDDEDADGIIELYGPLDPKFLTPAAIELLQGAYATDPLTADALAAWTTKTVDALYDAHASEALPQDKWPEEVTQAMGDAADRAIVIHAKQPSEHWLVFLVKSK